MWLNIPFWVPTRCLSWLLTKRGATVVPYHKMDWTIATSSNKLTNGEFSAKLPMYILKSLWLIDFIEFTNTEQFVQLNV